jgi:AraC-type DNA-binding domain-containing proteins
MRSMSLAEQPAISHQAAWQRAMSENFVPCTTRVPDNFRGTVTHSRLGSLDLHWVSASRHRADRTGTDLGARGVGCILLNVVTEGSVCVSQDGRQALLRQGDFAIHDAARPYSLVFDTAFAQVIFCLPRSLLRQRMGCFNHYTAVRVPGDLQIGQVASHFMVNVARLHWGEPASPEAQRLSLQVIDLVALALSMRRDTPLRESSSTHRSALLYRAKAFVEAHLSAELNPAMVAAALGCSARYVNNLFADEETTLGRYVMERRLGQCRLDLARGSDHRQIGEIAYAWGFASLSHFSRSFKERFDLSPSEYRAQQAACVTPTGKSLPSSGRVGSVVQRVASASIPASSPSTAW